MVKLGFAGVYNYLITKGGPFFNGAFNLYYLGGWLNQPHLKNICASRQIGWNIFPKFRSEDKTYLKPPTSKLVAVI